ncbi:capsid protein [Antarctic virus COCH21_47]|uniref:Capsid protein n=1 Tax=Antarctic virus COCH21_47 TaxID=2664242 RepID=A0A5Q2EYU7_9VIRU|nr:capsid protein [Antarctic virus COCH21_47]
MPRSTLGRLYTPLAYSTGGAISQAALRAAYNAAHPYIKRVGNKVITSVTKSAARSAGAAADKFFTTVSDKAGNLFAAPVATAAAVPLGPMRRGKLGGATFGGKQRRGRKHKVRKNKSIKEKNTGVSWTHSYGKLVSAADALHVGMCTSPAVQVKYMAGMALLKWLLSKRGLQAETLDSIVGGTGDGIRLEYRQSATSITSDVSFIGGSPPFTLRNFANWWIDILRPWNNTSIPEEFEMQSVSYLNAAGAAERFDVRGGRWNVSSACNFKIQNRTVNVVAAVPDPDATDTVDNQPLHGYLLTGTGTGPNILHELTSPNSFMGDTTWGVIEGNSSFMGPTSVYRRVLKPGDFNNVKYVSKVNLNPGTMKTASVYHKHSMTANKFLSAFNTYQIPDITPITLIPGKRPWGKYMIFSLSKVMDSSSGVTVRAAFEAEMRMTAVFTCRSTFITAPYVNRVYGQ